MNKKITGKEIKKFRGVLGISQKELAEELGIYWTTISRWENSRFEPSHLSERAIRGLMTAYYGELDNEKEEEAKEG